MAVLHQALPILHRRDAVGTHALHVQQLLRDHGLESEIYVGVVDPETAHLSRPIDTYAGGPVLYQHAVASSVVDVLVARADRLAVNSHNSTPTAYFARWDPTLVAATATSGDDLGRLRPHCALAIADSTFNANQLLRSGYLSCAVVPVLFETTRGTAPPSEEADVHQWLFVGRIVPNKAQHDLVLALAAARRHVDPEATLVLAGSVSSVPYHAALQRLIVRLGLGDAVRISGPLDDASLAALYRTSGVYVSASDHEGFGVPLVEAMANGLPLVAYDAAAVGETVGSGGVLLASKRPLDIAIAAWDAGQPATRARLAEAGRQRADRFALARTRVEMWEALRPLLADRE